MLEAWLFRGIDLGPFVQISHTSSNRPTLCWRSLNPSMQRAGFSVSASAVARHTVGAT